MTTPVLVAIVNPDVALILLLLGILLLYAEFNRPGTILLAAGGTLSLTLGGYGFALHPIRGFALVFVFLGLATVVASLRFPASVIPGTAILAYGLGTLFAGTPHIHLTTAVLTSLTFSTITLWLGRIALQARRNKRAPMPWNPIPNSIQHSAMPARRVD